MKMLANRIVINTITAFLLFNYSFPALASSVIAHRGVYHDVNTNLSIPENSYAAVTRAYDLGLKGVELDIRYDKNFNVLVTHDLITNRTTIDDGLSGVMNAVSVALNIQKAPTPIYFSNLVPSQWSGLGLKSYGRNSTLVGNPANNQIETLQGMLHDLQTYRNDIAKNNKFMIILDIQDNLMLRYAASIVKTYGMTGNVYLKFFASKALSSGYSYNGSDTCYVYAKNEGLTGLNIIPQINDGELDTYDDDDAGIYAFGQTLPINTYLQCWADAQSQHSDAAKMPIVSASVPAQDVKATKGALQAISWAQSHGRQTMTIVPNPDAGKSISGTCNLFSFQSTKVSAVSFNMDARQAKANFAANASVKPDYIIWDVMGNAGSKTWGTNFDYFTSNLC